MNLEDFKITICFDKEGEAYYSVTKKGEPHKCNKYELKKVADTFNLLSAMINSVLY